MSRRTPGRGARSRIGIARALGVVLLAAGCVHTAADVPTLKATARADVRAGRDDGALETLREAARLAPDDAEVFSLLGAVALRTGRPDEAEAALARAVALLPHDARPLAAHGIALRALERYPEAESALLRSLFLRPADAATLAALGEVYRMWGRPEKCAVRYEQFLWSLQRDGIPASPDAARALDLGRSRLRECEQASRSTEAVGKIR